MSEVVLGGLRLPDWATDGWVFRELEDWHSLSASKTPVNERPKTRGAFGVSSVDRESLAFSLGVSYLGSGRLDLLTAQRMLKAAVGDGPVVMSVTDELGSSWRSVTVEAITAADTWDENGEFDIDLIARDPIMYGTPSTDSTGLPVPGTGIVFPIVFPIELGEPASRGELVLENSGSVPVSPVFTMSGGGVESFTVTALSTQRRLTWSASVGGGSVVVLDGRKRRALLNGGYVSAVFLSSREWPSVAPGSTETFSFRATGVQGEPILSAELVPGWW